MIAGCDRRDGWVGPSSELETDCERALVGYGTCSTRAKWRSSRSACSSALQKELDTADIVREGILQQLRTEVAKLSGGLVEECWGLGGFKLQPSLPVQLLLLFESHRSRLAAATASPRGCSRPR